MPDLWRMGCASANVLESTNAHTKTTVVSFTLFVSRVVSDLKSHVGTTERTTVLRCGRWPFEFPRRGFRGRVDERRCLDITRRLDER